MTKVRHPVERGIPALVFIPTDRKITIEGKPYTVLKMFYDLKGEYIPLAAPMSV